MCPVTGCEIGRFHRFSRPGFWDDSQDDMRKRFPPCSFNEESNAVPFPVVMRGLRAWIAEVAGKALGELKSEDFLFVTCGNWDVKTIMPKQCNKPLPGTVDMHTQRLLLGRWCNLKEAFRWHYKLSPSAAPTGMKGMLKRLGIPPVGQHHLGMDDVSNLAKILRTLVVHGACLEATGYADGVHRSAGTRPAQGTGTASLGSRPATSSGLSLNALFEPTGGLGVKRRASIAFSSEQAPAPDPSIAADSGCDEDVIDLAGVSELPVSAGSLLPSRSGSSILSKYSALRRADDAGHDVRIKRRATGPSPGWAPAVPEVPDGNLTFTKRTARGAGKGKGKGKHKGKDKGKNTTSLGGKCRFSR